MRDRKIAAESPEIAQVVMTWEREAGKEKSVDPGAAIGTAAVGQRGSPVRTNYAVIRRIYGAETGNLALKLSTLPVVYTSLVESQPKYFL